MSTLDFFIKKLEDQYDANDDVVPGAPIVTWADKQLLDLIKGLGDQIEVLREEIEALKSETVSPER